MQTGQIVSLCCEFSLVLLTAACAAVPTVPGSTTVPVPTAAAAAAATTKPVSSSDVPADATDAVPAERCTVPAAQTPALTEGPYFKAGSPERTSLLDNLPGLRLVLTGYVLDTNCKPVPGALLDFWQADSLGAYDNSGYTLRGHQRSDSAGRYHLETVVPGLYPGRTEHIHFKVQAVDGGPVLTSQLFFPGVAQNSEDGIYDPGLLIQVQSQNASEMQATFDFFVAAP